MNKKVMILYIIMVIVGVCILFVMNSTPDSDNTPSDTVNEPTVPVIPQPVMEDILVARALHDISVGTRLSETDYQLETLSIVQGSSEKTYFSLSPEQSIMQSAVRQPIKQGTLIPIAGLIAPDSLEYIKMSVQAGMVLYPFSLMKSDNYLLDNLKNGDKIDIYLTYSANPRSFGAQNDIELVSPSNNFSRTRMKPIIVARRILSIEPASLTTENGITDIAAGSRLLVELHPQEVKLLKGLEGNAKLQLFPTVLELPGDNNNKRIMQGTEEMWPVSTDAIFSSDLLGRAAQQAAVVELRGE